MREGNKFRVKHFRHIKPAKGRSIGALAGTMVSLTDSQTTVIGFTVANPKDKDLSKAMGRERALEAMEDSPITVDSKVFGEMIYFPGDLWRSLVAFSGFSRPIYLRQVR